MSFYVEGEIGIRRIELRVIVGREGECLKICFYEN